MDKYRELEELVTLELTNLERLADEMNDLFSEIGEVKTSFKVRAAGSILHDFYCGIEKIFERIALVVDKRVPSGMNWHTELLLQMGKKVDGVRDEILPNELLVKLKEFLRFRHLFRHIYGFELKWDRIENLCMEVGDVLLYLKEEVKKFFL
jgi:hypothetical protein